MSYCGDSILTTTQGRDKVAVTLHCRSWNCEECAERRKRELIALAKDGRPNKFLTLTSRRGENQEPEAAARALVRAWRLIRRNHERAHPNNKIEFLAIFEATQLGWPHLHVLLRCKFIDQRWLSAEMERLANSPIVDIRAITTTRAAARYVTKYIGKAPGKFGTLKRYWHSEGYELSDYEKPATGELWDIQRLTLTRWMDAWRSFGYAVELVSHFKAIAKAPCQ